MVRRSFTTTEKRKIVTDIVSKKDTVSLRSLCRENNIQIKQFQEWKKAFDENPFPSKRPTAKSFHTGRTSTIKHLEPEILSWFQERSGVGVRTTIPMIVVHLSKLDSDFRRKSENARKHAVRRVLQRHNIVYRQVTHESQKAPQETIETATEFMESVRSRMESGFRHQDYILNMDETPIYFDMALPRTLAVAGSRTVNGRLSKNPTKRVTVAVTVTASGKFLKPMIIYEGKPNGRIVREFPQYNPGGIYCCQDRAWRNKTTMERWIEKVLKPYIAAAPHGVIPLLLLDEYAVHRMEEITTQIRNLGCELITIPGGTTSHTQPVDVGVNKPLKGCVRSKWNDFLMSQDVTSPRFKPPSRAILANWIVEAMNEISEEVVKNAWRHRPFSYFPWEDQQYARAERRRRRAAARATTTTTEEADEGTIHYL